MGVNMFEEPKKVAENDKAIFYTSSMTEGAESYAKRAMEKAEVDLGEIRCLIAETKDDHTKEYALIHNGEWEYFSQKYENIGVHIDRMILIEKLGAAEEE